MSFAHFTFHISKGQFIILDLQGAYNEDEQEFVLSDPAFISNIPGGAIWGPTDLGTNTIK